VLRDKRDVGNAHWMESEKTNLKNLIHSSGFDTDNSGKRALNTMINPTDSNKANSADAKRSAAD